MTMQVDNHAGVSVVRVAGDLTGRDGGEVFSTVSKLLEQDKPRIVIDLTSVSMISSAGVGDLVRITAQANSQHGRVLLANPSPFVKGVFGTTKLDTFFEVFPDVDGALSELGCSN